MAWREEGITTVEMAKDSTSRYSKEYFSVLKAMGITNRNPSDAEISLINTWTRDYGFSMELIQEACSRTVLQTGQPSFPYADKILQRWKDKNIRTLGDVRLQDAQHQKRKLEKQCRKQTSRNLQLQTALTISISVTTILLNMRRNCLTNQIKSWKQIFL